jgi:hypothetical protein
MMQNSTSAFLAGPNEHLSGVLPDCKGRIALRWPIQEGSCKDQTQWVSEGNDDVGDVK